MFNILIKRLAKDNDVIHVNTRKQTIKSKHIVNLPLHIRKEIFEFYNCYVKLFLIAM